MNTALRLGFDLFQQGRNEEARDVLRRVVETDPNNPLAYHLLGIALLQTDDVEAGLAALANAAVLAPSDPIVHGNLAKGLGNAGRVQEALEAYARALTLDPRFVDAYLNRAALFTTLERWDEAERDCVRALQLNSTAPAAHTVYGGLLFATGRDEEALACLDRALVVSPFGADAWKMRGDVLMRLGRPDEAALNFEQALRQRTGDIDILLAYGDALLRAGRADAALNAFDRVLSQAAELAVAWTNRGAALCRLGRVDEALQDFTKAIALEPQNGVFRFNRGATFLDQGRYAEALEELGAAMALSPGLPNARLSAAFAHLATGSFERGWQLYQSRREVSHNARPAMDGPPLWLGDAPLDGRTILLRAEQGFGDTVQFCRYAAQIKAAGARVILRVPRSLLGLMHTLCGVDVLSSEDEPLPEADLQCLLMSLPLALGLSKPYSGGSAYLSADPHKVRAWRRRLGDAGTVRVGLVWASGKRSDPELDWVGRSRDVPFEQLRRLKGLDVQFVSLQKGEAAEKELRQACSTGWDGPAIFDVTEELVDFSDTAALIEALDLVISVDTATAHTAGALGKPVWLLNRHGGCWRWGVSGEDSAWYPTMKIYRQTRFGQWEDVLDRVRADVEALAQAGRSASPGS